jgi:hypothetical protein
MTVRGHTGKVAIDKPGREASGEIKPADILLLVLTVFKTVRK